MLYAIVRTLVPEARAQNGPCNLVIQNACAFVANGEITARVTLRCRAKEVPDKNPQKAIKGGCFVDEDLEACFEATGPAEVGTNLSVSLEFEGKDYEKGEGCCEDLHVQVRGSADNPVLRVRCPTLGGVELPLSEGSCPPCNSSA
ncbi:MAG: hypothetical protein U5R46_16320 [Gammaproteobacteria bacterium]|nr:hypothetical protein [Gammaproteobacteria bacterium]